MRSIRSSVKRNIISISSVTRADTTGDSGTTFNTRSNSFSIRRSVFKSLCFVGMSQPYHRSSACCYVSNASQDITGSRLMTFSARPGACAATSSNFPGRVR